MPDAQRDNCRVAEGGREVKRSFYISVQYRETDRDNERFITGGEAKQQIDPSYENTTFTSPQRHEMFGGHSTKHVDNTMDSLVGLIKFFVNI